MDTVNLSTKYWSLHYITVKFHHIYDTIMRNSMLSKNYHL